MERESEYIFTLLRKMVADGKPFSLLRFGDGEGLFCFYDDLSGRYVNASKKHWGEIPGLHFRHRISINIKRAFKGCDIAALPYGFDGVWWERAVDSFSDLYKNNVMAIPTCGLNIHIELDESGVLAELLQGREVVVVGSRDINMHLLDMGASGVECLPISEQYRFAKHKPVLPFYRQVEDIERKLRHIDVEGKLCLLGGGVAGKHFGNIMRDRGGMVIDMGSVFDKWAGIRSRSWIVVDG